MKTKKIILIVLVIIASLIIIDTIQARILKTSPLISWKDTEEDKDSWVDRGILIDTYYCVKEQDIITVDWKFKTSKFTCPIEEEIYEKINNYELDIMIYDIDYENENILILEKDNQKYYYANQKYNLYINSYDLTSDHNVYTKYTFKEVIEKNMLTFDNILSKAKKIDTYKDGGSKKYYFEEFNIIVCNSLTGNNDVIIGREEINGNLCM